MEVSLRNCLYRSCQPLIK